MNARAQPGETRPEAMPPVDSLQLGPLGHLIGFHLARATARTHAVYERDVGKRFGLKKVEFSLLMLLAANAAVTPKQLSRALAVTAPKTTLLLDALQQRGLIRRERSPLDGRSQHVVLSAKGEKLARDSAAVAATMESELVTRLSRGEHAMLVELLIKLGG